MSTATTTLLRIAFDDFCQKMNLSCAILYVEEPEFEVEPGLLKQRCLVLPTASVSPPTVDNALVFIDQQLR